MKTIDLFAISKQVIVKKERNYVEYKTGIEAPVGIVVLDDSDGVYDMVLCNSMHKGGEVVLKFKPIKTPAHPYEIGDKIGVLVIL